MGIKKRSDPDESALGPPDHQYQVSFSSSQEITEATAEEWEKKNYSHVWQGDWNGHDMSGGALGGGSKTK